MRFDGHQYENTTTPRLSTIPRSLLSRFSTSASVFFVSQLDLLLLPLYLHLPLFFLKLYSLSHFLSSSSSLYPSHLFSPFSSSFYSHPLSLLHLLSLLLSTLNSSGMDELVSSYRAGVLALYADGSSYGAAQYAPFMEKKVRMYTLCCDSHSMRTRMTTLLTVYFKL